MGRFTARCMNPWGYCDEADPPGPRLLFPMKAIVVAGARPNFMKVKPVLDALDRRQVKTVLVHTDQHYDAAMSDVFFDELGLRAPDHHLGVGSGTHAEQTARVMMGFEPLLDAEDPDLVVVAGDVNSTLACAVVGAKAGVVVAHIEAGLRSRDWSMPEEINRVVTDRVSDYLFASSEDAAVNLAAEGYREDQIHVVGNVMIDTLLANVERARSRPVRKNFGLSAGAFGLITLHRPSNVDDPDVLSRILEALGIVAHDCPLVFPVHPRTRQKLEELDVPKGVTLTDPLGYLDFIALESEAAVVFTDSGGVQEETTALGVPCLTLRENTERPVTVSEGTNTVVGRQAEDIIANAQRVLRDGVVPRRPELWDGRASDRIAEVLVAAPGAAQRLRPTDLVPAR